MVDIGVNPKEGASMPRSRRKKEAVRMSVSLDAQLYARLSVYAADNDVSLAWAVRRAVSDFVERHGQIEQAELPLMQPGQKE